MKKIKNCQGFTLIELLIYIAVVTGVMLSMVYFSLSVSGVNNKTTAAQEVQANGRVALDLISKKIQAAQGVNIGSSVFETEPGTLSLQMAEPNNPTVINLSQDDGVLQIAEGGGQAIAITTDEVKVTNLVFTNLTTPGERENIRILLTLEYANSSGDVEFDYSQNYQTAVSLRQ